MEEDGKGRNKGGVSSFLCMCVHVFDRTRTWVVRLKGVRAEREEDDDEGRKKQKCRERERESRLSGENGVAACEAKHTTATGGGGGDEEGGAETGGAGGKVRRGAVEKEKGN